ncbi:hypothetical protein T492DRAFT_934425 [Pavlovales sp. CCMP2436]|nr:hypothetical protein T492DRAFT_934425 [Pavlovales sp. CCMP2436]
MGADAALSLVLCTHFLLGELLRFPPGCTPGSQVSAEQEAVVVLSENPPPPPNPGGLAPAKNRAEPGSRRQKEALRNQDMLRRQKEFASGRSREARADLSWLHPVENSQGRLPHEGEVLVISDDAVLSQGIIPLDAVHPQDTKRGTFSPPARGTPMTSEAAVANKERLWAERAVFARQKAAQKSANRARKRAKEMARLQLQERDKELRRNAGAPAGERKRPGPTSASDGAEPAGMRAALQPRRPADKPTRIGPDGWPMLDEDTVLPREPVPVHHYPVRYSPFEADHGATEVGA